MTLIAEVQLRYDSTKLLGLTNPGASRATTVNTTILQRACDDVERYFLVHAGLTYDTTDATHNAMGSDGVIARLTMRSAAFGKGKGQLWKDFIQSLKDLAKTTTRVAAMPYSTSILEPSLDDRQDSTPKPHFDDEVFDRVIPGAPKPRPSSED